MGSRAERSVSVVINTLDRADSLAETLAACTQLTHPDFEVVVVCGPSSDHTDEVVAQWQDRIVLRRCPEANLSMSRNIGISASVGEVVAFIDDDGVPEPTWLDEICAGYDDPSVGAVGGVVYNHTGREFQIRFLLSDRLGNTTTFDEMPPGDFCFPGSSRYPSMLGCNSSFRRTALVAVGGFDEQYDYYLDETDVCVRLVDAGWVVRPLDGAPVHHKYLPSAVRSRAKVVTDLHTVVKNKVYFSIVNGRGHWPWTDIMSDDVRFAAAQREQLGAQLNARQIDDDGHAKGLATIDSGWSAGLSDGLAGRQRLFDPQQSEERPLHRFETVVNDDRLRVVLLSRTLPPEHPGGVGRYFLDLARSLAARGHEVRLVTSSSTHDRVDLEHGVWIHRITKVASDTPPTHVPPIPGPLWDNAGPVAAEVLRINRERRVDVVLSSIWDVEWAGVHALSSLPVVSAYTTPFSVVRATQPEAVSIDDTTADAVEHLERWAHSAAHAIQVNGEHIAGAVEGASGVQLDRTGTFVAPLGTAASPQARRRGVPDAADATVTAVFVGRFERRKGVDLLLEAIASMAESEPRLRFVLAGDDDLPDGRGSTYRRAFETEHGGLVDAGIVEFAGRLSDTDLEQLWDGADIAVLPSRFESFGLVYAEAMARALPVVALRGSGADEIVEDGVTGLLSEDQPASLAAAVLELAGDQGLRGRLGAAGLARYEQDFTLDAMADRFERLLSSVSARRPGRDWSVAKELLVTLPDGNVGEVLTEEGTRVEVPDGRVTLVLSGSGQVEVSTIEVSVDGVVGSWRVSGDEFHHIVVPAGAADVLVRHADGPAGRLAALVVADPGAHP